MNAAFFVARLGRVIATVLFLLTGMFLGEISDAAEKSAVQPKYGTQAVRLFHARKFLRSNEAPDFWALMPYYVHQATERSCSVASATMVVNACRAQADLAASD